MGSEELIANLFRI